MPKPMTNDGEQLREMNDAEFAQYKIDQAAHAAKVTADATAETNALTARREAIRKLKAIGLTDDEIKAIRRA